MGERDRESKIGAIYLKELKSYVTDREGEHNKIEQERKQRKNSKRDRKEETQRENAKREHKRENARE
jgi:hypothetical protein